MQRYVLKYFERILVLLLVASLLVINGLIEQKFAFLSFYYLPVILAGFYGGRRFAVVSAVFIASLAFFFQAIEGLGMDAGLTQDALLALVPWAGFLILTGNASAEASKKIPVSQAPGPDKRFELLHWSGGGSASAEKLGTLPDNGGKAEALLVLKDEAAYADVLVIFDGLPGGQPVEVRLHR